MAPSTDKLSAPGSASYGSNAMTVGDGTWDFSRNTFLLPNLQGLNFDTMRYNGMGNRFSTLPQYHRIILAHGIMGALIFLLFIPSSVMFARFYSRAREYPILYHAQLQIFSGLLLLVVFVLGFFAVGPERNLTNPHHGIGVAIFVLFILQLVGGRLIRRITKSRSLRRALHQWSGRAIALLGIVQIPLGLTLYGSPKYLFVLYTLWMILLSLVYFILSHCSEWRHEPSMHGDRFEAGRAQHTESERLPHSPKPKDERSSWIRWLGPLAAGAGVWALLRGRRRDRDRKDSPVRSLSFTSSRGPEVVLSRRGSESHIREKDSAPPRRSGGGLTKILAAAAAALGASKLASGIMNRRNDQREEDYSAVSTETPRRFRLRRGDEPALSEFSSDYTDYLRRPEETQTSLLPPSANRTHKIVPGLPVTPQQPFRSRDRDFDQSDYSSYVSPSRQPQRDHRESGFSQGILGGLGMGWFAQKLADRQARRQELRRLREEEAMRSGASASRVADDGFPSPTRRDSGRPAPARRATGHPGGAAISEVTSATESSIESRPLENSPTARPPTSHTETTHPAVLVPGHGVHTVPRSRSRARNEHAYMPPMPPDPHGVLHSDDGELYTSSADSRPQQRTSSRRRREGERAAAAAAARAGEVAANERDRYGSPSSQPVSVRVKMHDDRDRNVTLRRLTEDEARAVRGPRSRGESDGSLSSLDSPSYAQRYRRDSSQGRAERSAERRLKEGPLAPLSPPNPAFAKGFQKNKEPTYQAGQARPSASSPTDPRTASSMGSEGHGTWSALSDPLAGPELKGGESMAAEDRRRRRRLERRGAGSTRPSETEMFD